MFTIKENKTVMDAVHGYINIPKCFVNRLIDNKYFQRLRNIDQTGMKVLYPSAKHDRFSHSIGVFYLGNKAVDALLENFSKDQYWNIYTDKQSTIYWSKNKILFLIACLLHDIGHVPFSHSLENQIYNNTLIKEKNISEILTEKIINYEKEYYEYINIANHQNNLKIGSASHEQMGAMLIFCSELRERIKETINDLHELKYPIAGSEGILYAEHYNNEIIIDKVNDDKHSQIIFNDDLCFIARMILGIKYDHWTPERQIRNCFIDLLNSKNFDVDKLDYIVRDTQMSGISNVAVDVERLINSICIITKTKHINKELSNKIIKNPLTILNVKNENSNKEFLIDGHFKGVFKLEKYSKLFIKKDSAILKITGINNENILLKLKGADGIYFDESTDMIDAEDKKVASSFSQQYNCKVKVLKDKIHAINNGKLLGDMEVEIKKPIIISIDGKCNIKIKGKFESLSSIKIIEAESVKGYISEIELFDDTFKYDFTHNKTPNENGYNIFSIGFKKLALNVLSNVIDARNYLYLWIYGHQKVVYYTNFLLPIVSSGLSDVIKNNNDSFPLWDLNYQNLLYLDDNYIFTAIKHIYYVNFIEKREYKYKISNHKLYAELFNQLQIRNYYTCLYKSLSEFNLFLDNFSKFERQKIFSKIKKLNFYSKSKPKLIDKKDILAGYFNNSSIEKINNYIKKYDDNLKLKEIILVFVNFKFQKFDTQNIYVDMKKEIVPVSHFPFLGEQSNIFEKKDREDAKKEKEENINFYIYYKANNKFDDMNELVLNSIISLFKELVN